MTAWSSSLGGEVIYISLACDQYIFIKGDFNVFFSVLKNIYAD